MVFLVCVNPTLEENWLWVNVVDNDIGISNAPEKINRYGLVIMKERSNILAGDFELKRGNTNGPVWSNIAKLFIFDTYHVGLLDFNYTDIQDI